MAKAMPSPSAFLGKRRGNEYEQSPMEPMAPFDQSFKKIRTRPPEASSGHDFQGPENSCPQAGGLAQPLFGFQQPSKLRREDDSLDKPMQSSYQYLEQQVKYLECQLTSLRAEHAMVLNQKHQQLTDLTASKLQVLAECHKQHTEKEAILQEGKLLKKAVAIQDGRYRELMTQNTQLQECLRLAMEKLQEYDIANRNLQYELNLSRGSQQGFGGYGFPPQPPPDVF